MATWYKTGGWRKLIEAVEVERHTDDSVWIAGRRHARNSSFDKYFPSWTEARKHLVTGAEEMVKYAEQKLESDKKKLAEISAIPESAT